MLVVLVIIMFSGQAVVIEREGLDAGTCASIGQQFIDTGRAATFACLERFDA